MRAFVFTDKALKRHAGQFVWLSIDTEKTQNAEFLRKYPIRAWPSFYVIDPKTETVTVRWVGGATVAQLDKLFDDASRPGRGKPASAEAALARADRLYGEGRYADALPAYREALPSLRVDSPHYARAVDALLFCLQTTRDRPGCVAVAREQLPKLRRTASAANLAGSGLDCAIALPPDAAGRADAIAFFEAAAREIVADGSLHLAADDRSALYSSLADAREDAKDVEGARRIGRQWARELEGDADRAATPEQRTALDPNRLGSYEAAGEIEKAIPMLERSEKDFPNDYNPPARLAFVYWKLGRNAEALAASDRALARVYGPRRLRVLSNRADIQKASGDAGAAKRTLEEAIAFAEALPEGQRSADTIESLRKKLEGLEVAHS